METQLKVRAPRKPRSDKEIFDAFEEFGSLNMAEFCEMMEITDSTYYNWNNRYKQMKQSQGGGSFMYMVDDVLPMEQPNEPLRIEVRSPDGKVWRFFGQLDMDLIKHLM